MAPLLKTLQWFPVSFRWKSQAGMVLCDVATVPSPTSPHPLPARSHSGHAPVSKTQCLLTPLRGMLIRKDSVLLQKVENAKWLWLKKRTGKRSWKALKNLWILSMKLLLFNKENIIVTRVNSLLPSCLPALLETLLSIKPPSSTEHGNKGGGL